uniref:Uncharacterized protein n=1 Tax=Schistosoma haematobium TaxID=6185 RepID=A0A095BYV6_SCHHA
MPLVGIVFFCARCCGKCGGRVQFVDSKHDPCKRVVYTVCLVLIVTFQLAAVVLAFINHYLFHEALVSRDPRIGAFSQANLSLVEFEEALKDMVQMAKNTSSTDLSKQKERFMRIVDDSLVSFQEDFTKLSQANNVSDAISEFQTSAWNDLAHSPKTREKLASVFEHIMVNISTTLKFIRDRISLEINEEVNDHYLRGVGFMFLFSTILMVSCMIPFLFGGTLQTEVCRYLTGRYPDGPRKMDQYVFQSLKSIFLAVQGSLPNSSNSRTFDVDKNELEAIRPTLDIIRFNLSDAILTRCENEPFVEAISTGEFVSPILADAVDGILQGLIESFKKVDIESPFRRTIGSCLAAFERLKFLSAVNFKEAINQVNTPLTFIDNLGEFVSRLKALNMESLAPHIQTLVNGPVKLDATRGNIYTLFVRFNSLPDQMNFVINNLNRYNQTLSTSIQSSMNRGVNRFHLLLTKELQLAVIATWHDIPCQSLRLAAKRGVDSVCYTFLMPFNAFWTGLGFTLLLFIPAIIFAVKLAGLYRKTEKYSRDYEEPDYISYHGFYMRPPTDNVCCRD